MINQCYSVNHKNYNIYGGAGVRVSSRWHNFSLFFKDVQLLPGWDKNDFINNKITLDKDKLQQEIELKNKIYSRNTCCWLTICKQNELIDFVNAHEFEIRDFIVTFPDGHEEKQKGIKEFARKYNLTTQCISSCIKGSQKIHKGYKFRPL